ELGHKKAGALAASTQESTKPSAVPLHSFRDAIDDLDRVIPHPLYVPGLHIRSQPLLRPVSRGSLPPRHPRGSWRAAYLWQPSSRSRSLRTSLSTLPRIALPSAP